MKKTMLLASAMMIGAAFPAFADDNWKSLSPAERDQKIQEKFTELDTNSDGAVSREEFAATDKSPEQFTNADADKNGSLSLAEMKRWKEMKWNEASAYGSKDRMGTTGSTKSSH